MDNLGRVMDKTEVVYGKSKKLPELSHSLKVGQFLCQGQAGFLGWRLHASGPAKMSERMRIWRDLVYNQSQLCI